MRCPDGSRSAASIRALSRRGPGRRPFWAMSLNPAEFSIIVPEEAEPAESAVHPGWRAFRVRHSHSLQTTGVTAALVGPLAEAGLPTVVVGSFSTNHLLEPADRYREAVTPLFASGHEIARD